MKDDEKHKNQDLPDEIGENKKLDPSIYDSKRFVFNYHYLGGFIVPETKNIILNESKQSHCVAEVLL